MFGKMVTLKLEGNELYFAQNYRWSQTRNRYHHLKKANNNIMHTLCFQPVVRSAHVLPFIETSGTLGA